MHSISPSISTSNSISPLFPSISPSGSLYKYSIDTLTIPESFWNTKFLLTLSQLLSSLEVLVKFVDIPINSIFHPTCVVYGKSRDLCSTRIYSAAPMLI